jgi:hypothetical protein
MLKRIWHHLVRVPAGLDLWDKVYLRGLYFICGLLALVSLLSLVSAMLPSEAGFSERISLVAFSVAMASIAYGLRWLFYGVMAMQVYMQSFISSKIHLR